MEIQAVLKKAPSVDVVAKAVQAEAIINARMGAVSGQILITENGEHDVARYAKAIVNVPIPPNYGLITWDGAVLTVS